MNKIKQMRIERGLSQKDLAEKMGTMQVCISRWENGARVPKVNNLMKLADALKCDISELIEKK